MLDTHVVLDWLVFADARILPLAHTIEAGALQWIGCADTRAEFVHMLGSPRLARWSSDRAHALAEHDRLVQVRTVSAPDLRLRCRDPDDQVFIDLARAQAARWLLTRDRALLALTRRACAAGLSIITPEAWIARHAAAPLEPLATTP
ncbi:MAG: PIN domain-containing protein [Rubrivivax sp.]